MVGNCLCPIRNTSGKSTRSLCFTLGFSGYPQQSVRNTRLPAASKVATMKKILSASLLALFAASVAFPALAADLPSRKATPAYAAPAPTWTGFYAGLNAGGTWENSNSTYVTIWPTKDLSGYWTTSSLLAGGLATDGASGFIGGGQAGYNWQQDLSGFRFVAGFETDIQGIAGNKGAGYSPMSAVVLTFSDHNNFNTYSTTSSNNYLSYLGTARGRLGFLATPTMLIYGTGGLAYGQANLSLYQFQQFGIAVGWSSSTTSQTLVGWAAGGGLEWMFMPNWSAKAEYLYYDLGRQTTENQFVAYSPSGAQWTYGSYGRRAFNGNIVRAGVNYHFNWGRAPVVANY
jgi:outer membrane immunogenic protein